jgi:hypothetical protein
MKDFRATQQQCEASDIIMSRLRNLERNFARLPCPRTSANVPLLRESHLLGSDWAWLGFVRGRKVGKIGDDRAENKTAFEIQKTTASRCCSSEMQTSLFFFNRGDNYCSRFVPPAASERASEKERKKKEGGFALSRRSKRQGRVIIMVVEADRPKANFVLILAYSDVV